ncbi:2-C-methyl-D-erythritol 4-phosphate cytidylyltransferase [Tessaracoccus oleiagri]|uniref:2-C-methyl-D-erythritol 4-phosphate cytidylyltransferase n=1 Tax=Tessaracoccus oleiagri TaxID=686624 RepID=UPI000B823E25|nr:2-C-methyl-D-erythritol 4-phosphate cytidylyltransferase [Tessaracoccus oleiagri]
MTSDSAPVAAIVVAAGSGSRLGHPIPKALVELCGVPIVRRAVDALVEGGVQRVVVVAPASHLHEFRTILDGVPAPLVVVPGGVERQDSVRLGLDALGEASVVLVHDAARPLVPARVVGDVVRAVRDGARAVIPVLPVVDTVRRETTGGSSIVDRDELRAVQTPQGFDGALLREAHRNAVECALTVTDDASACEALGEPIAFVPGDREALKITEPFDLLVAEAIVGARRQRT